MLTIYFDGACEPTNPNGIATYGYLIYNGNNIIHKDSGIAGKPLTRYSTNNLAEYTALLEAIKYLYNTGYTGEIQVYGDSQLVIRQLTGIYSVKSENIKPLYIEIKKLEKTFRKISYNWIPREKNMEADKLSHRAYISYLRNNQDVLEKIKPMLATKKQIQLLEKLGIPVYPYMGRREASRLIKRSLQ